MWVWWGWTSQACNNGEDESRGIWRVFMWRLWLSQSCFSLGFLFQYSLWELSTFHGYKGYLYWREWNAKSQVFQNRAGWRLGLAAWLSRKFQPRGNWTASLYFLSCSAPAGMTLQLLACLACIQYLTACSRKLPARSSHESLLLCTILNISSHSLTHYPYMNLT